MDGVARIGVSLDPELLKIFDKLVSDRGYVSRSEAIRDLIREILSENEWKDEEQIMIGSIIIVYDLSFTGVMEKLAEMQVKFTDKVLSSNRVVLEDNRFMESIFVKGKLSDLKHISNEYTSLKGVLRGKLTLVSPVNGYLHHIGPKN